MEMWRGIHKVTEECGELLQVLGKLGPYPAGPHPDGGPELWRRAEDECADVLAAVQYFATTNNLDMRRITNRMEEKLEKFNKWELTGLHPSEGEQQ